MPSTDELIAVSQTNTLALLGFFLEHSPALVSFKTLDGRYTFANAELECAFGVGKEGLAGLSDFEFMPYAIAEELAAKDRAVVNSGRTARSLDRLTLPHGRELSVVSVRFPLADDKGKTLGVGYVAIDVTANKWDGDDALKEQERTLQRIVELQQAIEELKAQAVTDQLTGVHNRIHMEQTLQVEAERFARYGHQASLIFLDLDHFKQINDTLGHAAGDNTLRQVSRVLQEKIRSTDIIGRWGGEEFLILLPNTDLISARILAEKIRTALANHDRGNSALVSASLGVAQIKAEESWESWVARADAAMYAAKRNGRNRVEVDYGDAAELASAVNPSKSFVHLVWHASYDCGQPLIDKQHRALFESSNALISVMIDNWPAKDVKELLDCLFADVVEHFSTEEAILREAGYPGLDEHVKIHAHLLERADAVYQRFLNDEEVIGELFHFLVYEVIAQHMLFEDRRFFSLFAESGHRSRR